MQSAAKLIEREKKKEKHSQPVESELLPVA
jgi:hypothetical protein